MLTGGMMMTLFTWSALAPEIGVAALAVLVLALEIALPARLRIWLPVLVLACLAALAAAVVPAVLETASAPVSLFSGMLEQTRGLVAGNAPSTAAARLLLIAAAFLTVWLGGRFLRRNALPEAEFLHLTLFATAALMLLTQCANFAAFYVALEAATVGLCALAGYNRESGGSQEAGVKYLVAAGLSGALLLFGIALIYGTTALAGAAGGSFDALSFAAVRAHLAANAGDPLALAGVALVTAGVAFKVGLFPFQLWVPDVYQGAPTPATAFLATASKTAGVLALLLLASGPFAPLVAAGNGALFGLLALLTGATLVFANLSALGQNNTKRLMGLSGLSHAGFLMLAVLAVLAGGGAFAAGALLLYLAAYIAGAFTVFAVMGETPIPRSDPDADTAQAVTDFQLLCQRSPFLAWTLGIGLGSLAGIPPTVGFVAKFLVIAAAFYAGLWWLAGVALLCVGAGVYYYFGWIREAFQRVWLPEERLAEVNTQLKVPWGARFGLTVLGIVLLVAGIAPCVTSLLPALLSPVTGK